MVRNLSSLHQNKNSSLRRDLQTNPGDAPNAVQRKRLNLGLLVVITHVKNAKCFPPSVLRVEERRQFHFGHPVINQCIVENASSPCHVIIGKQKPLLFFYRGGFSNLQQAFISEVQIDIFLFLLFDLSCILEYNSLEHSGQISCVNSASECSSI